MQLYSLHFSKNCIEKSHENKTIIYRYSSSSAFRKLRSWHPVPSLLGKQMGKQWKLWLTLFWGGSKITADGDCSHEIKRRLLLGRKIMINIIRQHIKKQRHYFANKGPYSQGYGISSCHVWIWELDYKESSEELMLLNCGAGEDSWESLGLQGDPTSPS